MKDKGGGHYLRAVNDGARTVYNSIFYYKNARWGGGNYSLIKTYNGNLST